MRFNVMLSARIKPVSPEEFSARVQRDILETFAYFSDHLTFKDRDIRSLILIGHLLVEEQLVAYVNAHLARPKKLNRFTFDHYLQWRWL